MTAQAEMRLKLGRGLCVRGHIRPFELFHHVVSESPLAWSHRTQSPTRWFWRPANSLAVGWYLAELILPGSACLGNGDASPQETGKRFGTEGKLQQCLWEWGASSPAEGSRSEEEMPSRASAMCSDSLGLQETEGLQVTVACRHQRGWFL